MNREILQKRIHNYLAKKGKRKPDPEPRMEPEESKEEQLTPAEELSIEWEIWADKHGTAILIFKALLGFVFLVSLLWALAVVDIQNNCYLDKDCREWIEENR